jgi:NAD(P)-dependent dehydrogenase (short-subunit alcohol dehydrogenase family)
MSSRASPESSDHDAVVFGASGTIGAAVADELESRQAFRRVVRVGRRSPCMADLADEASVARAAADLDAGGVCAGLVFIATGYLHDMQAGPEKALGQIDPVQMARAFAVNTIGPALVLKHFEKLLPRSGRAVVAALSARVGSIGDNGLGGWYSYRASKAALNQIVRTAAIELRRRRPDSICVALHPGTVASPLSAPFSRNASRVQTPAEAACRLVDVLKGLRPVHSGGFFDYEGEPVPW